MIAYVESNFILELAYLQEQHTSCEELLALAEMGVLTLGLPAFSITESRQSLSRRAHRRRKLNDRLKRELRELSRSKPYLELSGTTEPLTTALVQSGEEEKRRLDEVLNRVLRTCRILPIHARTVRLAFDQERAVGLRPSDAVVLATILEDLATSPEGPRCFLNRNSRDFANPDVYDELSKYECKLLPSFKDGVGYIRQNITPES